jgi:selenocysteine-specific elongation factor
MSERGERVAGADRALVVATAGHVDHGKSSLVLALTGTDPDRFEEEQRRGLTIDLGFAHTTLPSGAHLSFVDVPGHVRFLPNMLAGAGMVGACLFVVAATEGWKPQSEEHLRILELLGVRHGVVALTKIDLVDDETRQLAALDVAERVAGTFLVGEPMVEVAAPAGTGVEELRAALDDLVGRAPTAADRGRPRLWVDRSFAAKGAGTVVTGTLTDGSLTTGASVVVGSARHRARVRAIQIAGRPLEAVAPGQRVALNLAGLERGDVERGDAVRLADDWHDSARFDATLRVLESLDHEVSRRGAYLAYIGSGEHPVRLRILGPSAIAPGGEGLVRLHLASAVPLLPGDRYVLRESGRDETVGGGEVLDVAPVRPASKATPDRSVDRVIDERGWIDADELALLTGERRPATVGRWVVSPGAQQSAAAELHVLVASAGDLGLEVGRLDERQRALAAADAGLVAAHGRLRAADANDGGDDRLGSLPEVARLRAGGLTPEPLAGLDRATVRALVQRGVAVERGGIAFHREAIERAAAIATRLAAEHPDGFSVGQFREASGTTRKHAVPLLEELDARAVTRRRGDLRVAGGRSPRRTT